MSEWIYRRLLRLYPARFREEYGAEAVRLFRDRLRDEGGLARRFRLWIDLIFDLVVSLPIEYRREPLHENAVATVHDGPIFYQCGPETPSRASLINGGIATIAIFGGLILFMGSRGRTEPTWLLGSHHPSPSHILPALTKAVPKTELDSEVKLKPTPYEPPISPYFKLVLVLGALDVDRDNEISAAEIENAAAALRTLDKNHDGKLSAEECGAIVRNPKYAADPAFTRRFRASFMRVHPVLAALDADHNGEISAREMRNAPAALRTLDRNHDGKLVEDELRPAPGAIFASQFMIMFDTNEDGRISREEFAKTGLRASFFDAADRNHDGFLTEDEVDSRGRRPKPRRRQ